MATLFRPNSTSADTWSNQSSDEDSKESTKLLSFNENSSAVRALQKPSPRRLLIANLLLFGSSLLILFATLLIIPFIASSSRQEIAWSPVLDQVPVRSVHFNETFGFPSTYPSKFQGKPSKEVDEEWARFAQHPMMDGRLGRMGVPFSAIARMEKAADADWLASVVKLGDDKYMANLDLFHNAHCLNMLRKMIYPEYYTSYAAAERGHLEHCLETLRQAIFCNSGTGLVTFHWVEGIEDPYPDYNVAHQCRDPESMLHWALENAVHTPAKGVRRKPSEELKTHPE